MPADVPILQMPKPSYSHGRSSTEDSSEPNTGARTPRHVQWASAVNVQDHGTTEVRELDEAGEDPEAFKRLSSALRDEKSRSRSASPPIDSATPSEIAPLNPLNPTEDPSKLIAHREVFIDPNERAGLPVPSTADEDKVAADAAASLVRAHTRRRRILPSLPKLRLAKKDPTERQRALESARNGRAGTPDIEMSAASQPGGAAVGGGILSALLALYDQRSDSETSSLTTSSGVPTPPRPGRGRTAARRRAATPSTADSSLERAPQSGSASARMRMPDFSKAFGFDGRPNKTRSGAGVLGPLIATTAGAAAPAAPTASTVVPDVKRPGYHLSRYSLEDSKPARYRPHKHSKSETLSMGGLGFTGGAPLTAPPTVESAEGYFALPPSGRESPAPTPAPGYKARWSGALKDLPTPSFMTPAGTRTPGTDVSEDSGAEWGGGGEKRRKRRKRKAEIFITRHISDVLARQTFICKFARAMMMFGAPPHRLQAQIMSTGRVLEVPLSCMYLPDTILLSFDDQTTCTSNIQLIKQSSALDLAKLTFAYKTYWAVIHDEISVKDASTEFDELMRSKSTYSTPALIFFGGMASAAICSLSFAGSFVDSLVCFVLGCILVFVQTLSARNELYSNMFEITMCTFISFIAAALAQTKAMCYPAIASGSVVLILPGYFFLTGSLEISSRSIVSGSVRLCYAIIYALFLGFGLAIGLEVFVRITGVSTDSFATDYACASSHDASKWYRATASEWWAFLTVPMFSVFLSLRNHAPWCRRELPALVAISCIGWVTNHYVTTAFPNQNDISSAVGAFAVGLIANLYGRLFRGNAFVVMITGILFQLPSGLSNGGLITFASQSTSGESNSYLSGFQTALQLISTSIGMTVGLGISLVVVFPIQSRRRAGGVFSL